MFFKHIRIQIQTTTMILLVSSMFSISAIGQTIQSYLGYKKSTGPIPGYNATIVQINSDSTYLRIDYLGSGKKLLSDFKNCPSEKSVGRIRKEGTYYRMTEYRDGQPTDHLLKVRITSSSITFWDYSETPKRKYRGMILKRMKVKQQEEQMLEDM